MRLRTKISSPKNIEIKEIKWVEELKHDNFSLRNFSKNKQLRLDSLRDEWKVKVKKELKYQSKNFQQLNVFVLSS
jgi:hypothetical protein